MKFLISAAALLTLVSARVFAAEPATRTPFDPRGQIHIPIGIPNALDSLKTFVEPEGIFSPGFGTYGIYFWVWDPEAKKLFAPTLDGISCEHGLADGGLLIPWAKWSAGNIEVQTEVCEVVRPLETNRITVVGARVRLTNRGPSPRATSLFVVLRPLGPAGGFVKSVGFSDVKDTLAANGYPAVAAVERAQAVGALTNDTISQWAFRGECPPDRYMSGTNGECSGAMRYDLTLPAGESHTFGFSCPVLPNAWAVRHRWDATNAWAQFDLNKPYTTNAGVFQMYPSLKFYRLARAESLFADATNFWREFTGRISARLPDARWSEGLAAMQSHLALCLNEGALDVAVANYNVFNRDAVFMASALEKTGHPDLAASALDYFIAHPFNGRVQPEADNPGEILWALAEHWRFSRDRAWLERVFPSIQKLAAMIRYYRTTPGPHYVSDTGLDFGNALQPEGRKELKPGACDGQHPEFTDAWDIAGLRGAAECAGALGKTDDAGDWKKLAEDLLGKYDAQFGSDVSHGYGSYSVLWPCKLYPAQEGKAFEKFKIVGAQKPEGWRYFALSRAHQGLLAGSRTAAAETTAQHLDHPQMRRWFAFDEGGDSGVGGWNNVMTTWRTGKTSIAMPHGWVLAEMLLLMRDALVTEDGDRLILFGGVPMEWFKHPTGMRFENFPTHFGKCTASWTVTGNAATLALSGPAADSAKFTLRLPPQLNATVSISEKSIQAAGESYVLPPSAREVRVVWK